MTPKKLFRTAIFTAFIVLGAWFAFSAGFGADVAGTAGGPQAFAPSGTGNGNASPAADRGFASPVSVNLRDIPAGQYDPNNQLDRWRRGEIQLERGDSIIDRARMEDMRVGHRGWWRGIPRPSSCTGGNRVPSRHMALQSSP